MALSVKYPKALCKCVKLRCSSLVVLYTAPSRLTGQSATYLPSKIQNYLHTNQADPEKNARGKLTYLHSCDYTGKVDQQCLKNEGTFVYHPSKKVQHLTTFTVQRCFTEPWIRQALTDRRQLPLMAWNHERLMGKLLLQHGVKSNLCQEDYPESCIRQNVCISGKDISSENANLSFVKAKERYINELSCAPIVMMSDANKTSERKQTVTDGPDAMQMENMFTFLCEELPRYFCEPLNFDVYHKNIAFVNDITGITTRGLFMYKSMLCAVKYSLLLCMMDLSVEVLKITKHSNDNTIKVRWRIKGEPRLRAWVCRGTKGSGKERFRYLDGFSVFEVGSDGLVHCHRLHKVMPSSPRQKESPLWVLNYLAVLGLLNKHRREEVLGMFECRSTDEGLDSVSPDSSTAPVPC